MSRASVHLAIRAAAVLIGLCCSTFLPAQMQMPAYHAMPANTDIAAPETLPPPQKLTGIGNLHFPISSHNPETQAWFDQGINLVFDFWDYEANRAFEQAIRTDPNCAICHWALAESLGIHNNEVRGFAHDELAKAISLRSHADKREKKYIDASHAEESASPTPKSARVKAPRSSARSSKNIPGTPPLACFSPKPFRMATTAEKPAPEQPR